MTVSIRYREHARTFGAPSVAGALVALVMAAAALAPVASAAGPGSTLLLSRPAGFAPAPAATDGDSFLQSARSSSGDGTRIVFDSGAADLGAGSAAAVVVLRDTATNTTFEVDRLPGVPSGFLLAQDPSISRDGTAVCFDAFPALASAHTDHVYVARLSGDSVTSITQVDRASGASGAVGDDSGGGDCVLDHDGSHVAFASSATNLVANDNNGRSDVFERDLVGAAHTTTLVDRSTAGVIASTGADSPSIDADGGEVAFETSAALNAVDTNNADDIYVRTLSGPSTTLASLGSGAVATDGSSDHPSLDDAGDEVAFDSTATNFGDGDTDATKDIHVRDLTSTTTTLASRATGVSGLKGDADSTLPALSGDGTAVAFVSSATTLGVAAPTAFAEAYLRTLTTGVTNEFSRASGGGSFDDGTVPAVPSLDTDATHVAWTSVGRGLDPGELGQHVEVYQRTRAGTLPTTLISTPSGATGRTAGAAPSNLLFSALTSSELDCFTDDVCAKVRPNQARTISADGRFVVFESTATNLDPSGGAGGLDNQIYVRDNLTGATTLVSRSTVAGAAGNGDSLAPTISADGSTVAFVSFARNLTPGSPPPGETYISTLATGAIQLASTNSFGGADPNSNHLAGGAAPSGPSLDANGSQVAFTSPTRLTTDAPAGDSLYVYVHNTLTGTTTLASTGLPDADTQAAEPSIDGAGDRVAFLAGAALNDPAICACIGGSGTVYVRDLAAATTVQAPQPTLGKSTQPQLSASGTRVAYGYLGTSAGPAGVYVSDLGGATVLASRADGPLGAPLTMLDLLTEPIALSYDGTHAAFDVEIPQPNTFPPFIVQAEERNIAAGSTTLLSAADASAAPANAGAAIGSLDVDGSCATFTSTSTNLVTESNTGGARQVFARVLSRECPLVAPDTALDAGPDGAAITVPTATFAYHSTEAGSTFSCQLDGSAFVPCGATFTTPALANGAHQFAVEATDAALNTDATPAQATFSVAVPAIVPARVKLSKLRVTHTKFRLGAHATATVAKAKAKPKKKVTKPAPAGTTFEYTLSQAAPVRIVIEHREGGRRKTSSSKSSCVKSAKALRRHKSCTRSIFEVTLRRNGKLGANATAFSGRWGKHGKLADGSYAAIVTATNSAQVSSNSETVRFTVVKK